MLRMRRSKYCQCRLQRDGWLRICELRWRQSIAALGICHCQCSHRHLGRRLRVRNPAAYPLGIPFNGFSGCPFSKYSTQDVVVITSDDGGSGLELKI